MIDELRLTIEPYGDVETLVAQIQDWFDEICQSEAGRYLRKMESLEARAAPEVREMASRIAAAVADPLVACLRNEGQDPEDREVCMELAHWICHPYY